MTECSKQAERDSPLLFLHVNRMLSLHFVQRVISSLRMFKSCPSDHHVMMSPYFKSLLHLCIDALIMTTRVSYSIACVTCCFDDTRVPPASAS